MNIWFPFLSSLAISLLLFLPSEAEGDKSKNSGAEKNTHKVEALKANAQKAGGKANSTNSETTSRPKNYAAQILTRELAREILGGSVNASPSNTYKDAVNGKSFVSNANFLLRKDENPPVLGLLIRHEADAKSALAKFNKAKAELKGAPVSGLGVQAFRTAKPQELHLLKGLNYLVITAGTADKPDKVMEEQLAKAVLPEIKF
ncbi:MAG: hypothetical protein K2Y32_19405 [Candidatus Obscuribacterales bacterium]|nr:hypothetical protein [Candidatus Obscuribacterales bacterium]